MTDATPTPMPPTTRKITTIQTLGARPVPIALIRNSTAAIFITDSRPILSASRPAVIAPDRGAQQRRGDREAESALPMPKSSWIESTAPLITALS